MRTGTWPVLSVIGVTAAIGVAGCGSDGNAAGGDDTLNVYSSMPLQGDARARATDIVDGERLALEQAGGKVGRFKVKLTSLDDSTAAAGKWEAGKVSDNARKAIADDSTIAYIGEMNSGGTAISIPLLNEANILQLSPAATSVGLTRKQGADEGEPDKYYPSGVRTFGRIVPADHVQAAAQISYLKAEGVTKLFLVNDKEVYGQGLADQIAELAPAQGIQVLGNEGIDIKAANFRSLASKVAATGADGIFFGGITANKAVQVFNDLGARNPDAKLFGPDGVAEEAFVAELGEDVAGRTFITNPTLDPDEYPAEAKTFFADFKEKYGHEADAYAVYGYESMNAVLTAVKAAGPEGDDREAVVKGFFSIKDRRSVLGTYSIDPNGDATLATYGGYTAKGGKLTFDRAIKAATTSAE